MSLPNPSFLFSKLTETNLVFRLYLLGIISSTFGLLLYYGDFGDTLQDSAKTILYVLMSSPVFLIMLIPELKKLLNKQKGIDTLLTESEGIPTVDELEKIQEEPIELEKQTMDMPDPDELKRLLKIENTAQLKTIYEKLDKISKSLLDVKEKQKKYETEANDLKKTFYDLKRKGVLKIDSVENAVTELMAFRAEIDNPFNFINQYFQMLNTPDMIQKKLSKDTLEKLKHLPEIESLSIKEV